MGLDYIEVNLSATQCSQRDLADRYLTIMEDIGISTERINLEITETAQITASKNLMRNMHDLMGAGVRFSLDDFGTGHSNLDYLTSMPVDIIKFDYKMTHSYFENEKTRKMFAHVIPMFKEMGMEIVCEGVETKEELDTLSSFGVEHIQGFYFSKPIPKDEYLEFIRKNNKKRAG